MKLNDPRRMEHCRFSSQWACNYPECGCNLTYDEPQEKSNDNSVYSCPKCGTVLYKRVDTAEIYSLKIKCNKCKNTFSVNREKDRLKIKMDNV